MKHLTKLTLALVLALISAVPAYAKGKGPSVAKSYTYYYRKEYSFPGYIEPTHEYYPDGYSYSLYGSIDIKNITKSARITSAKLTGASSAYTVSYYKMKKFAPEIYIGLKDDKKKVKKTSFKLNFSVKQNGKTAKLSTKINVKPQPFVLKSLTIGGKSYLKSFSSAANYIKADNLAGKHPAISYSVKKPYKTGDITGSKECEVYRLENDKFVKYSKIDQLKKGDVISFDYVKKGWAKPDSYFVVVKS